MLLFPFGTFVLLLWCVSTAKGKAASHASGFITSVATRAAQLSPQGKHEVPTVCIETEAKYVILFDVV